MELPVYHVTEHGNDYDDDGDDAYVLIELQNPHLTQPSNNRWRNDGTINNNNNTVI